MEKKYKLFLIERKVIELHSQFCSISLLENKSDKSGGLCSYQLLRRQCETKNKHHSLTTVNLMLIQFKFLCLLPQIDLFVMYSMLRVLFFQYVICEEPKHLKNSYIRTLKKEETTEIISGLFLILMLLPIPCKIFLHKCRF